MDSIHPPIATLPEPVSDGESEALEENSFNQASLLDPPNTATQIGVYKFVIPSRLSPAPPDPRAGQKRRISAASSFRAAKARRTSASASCDVIDVVCQFRDLVLQSSAAAPSTGPPRPDIATENSGEPSQVFRPLSRPLISAKVKGPARSPQMSNAPVGRLASFFNRSRDQKPPTSAPAKLQPDTIVIDSSDDEAENAPAQSAASQPPPTLRIQDVIDISDSDLDDAVGIPVANTRSSPVSQSSHRPDVPKSARDSLSHLNSHSKPTSPTSTESAVNAENLRFEPPAPLEPLALPERDNALTIPLVEPLPPLPASSDIEHSSDQSRSSPTQFDSVNKPHLKPRDTQESGSDSGSSGRLVESAIALDEPEEPSFVLNSEGSSGSRNASPHRNASTTENVERGRERSATLTSLRDRSTIRSSPSPGPPRSGDVTEAELEDIVANVSLHDPQPQADKSIAQTVAGVGSMVLDDGFEPGQRSANEGQLERSNSASDSMSSGGRVLYKCSIEGCPSRFSSTSQLHTHMSRDHGVRLSHEKRKAHGKRKAVDHPKTPTKRKFTGSRLAQLPPPLEASTYDSSSRGSQDSDRYVERTNTVGFEPFVRRLSVRPSKSPETNEDDDDDDGAPDYITISDASISSPRTPAPSAPKLRRPHPKDRPVIPDTPSENLSPSKQLAIKKHEVIIPGEQLVTWRVDIVNSMPESYRNGPGARLVFEGFMDEAMRENEPCAPAIRVENAVDDQPCPPWEFVYSNRVYYGENVPRPNRDLLEGCNCLGPCDPNNEDCACVRKQNAVWAKLEGLEDYTGFAFNPDGTIRFHHGEIYGCNSKCTCDLECQNKVWQQGRKYAVSIRKTKAKGWGVFAKEHIPAGSYIGIYTGELLTEGMADKRGLVYDEFGRTYVLSTDFHHIDQTNGLPNYAIDAFHAGNFTRFLNHSCNPNLVLSALYIEDPDIRKPWLALFSDQEIKPGQELTFSYTGMDVNDPADQLKAEEAKRKAARGKGKRGKVFEECLCGAEGCFGILFK